MKRLDVFNQLHPGGKSYDYQRQWVFDEAKYKLAAKARQIGITTTEAIDRFIECVLWQESERSPIPPVIVFCSPSQRQSNRLMLYIQRAKTRFEKAFQVDVKFRKEREEFLIFDNYAEIWSLPNNPKTIEGIDASQGVIDEASNFDGQEDRQVYQAMLGSLGAKNGGIVIFGRPRGRRGLFWDLYDPYGPYASQFAIHKFPWTVRARHDPSYKQSVEEHKTRLSPMQFAEQYECEFVDESVVIFSYELLDRQKRPIRLLTLNDEIPRFDPIYMGIDFGKKVNQTVITAVAHGKEKTRMIFKLVTQADFNEQISLICQSLDHLKPVKCLVDELGQGLPLLDILKAKYHGVVEGVLFSGSSKEKLVLTTRNLLEEGRLELPDDKSLLEQLHGFEKTIMESGRIKYTGKRTETDWLDDEACSLFMACAQLGEGEWGFTITENKSGKIITMADMWRRDLNQFGEPID